VLGGFEEEYRVFLTGLTGDIKQTREIYEDWEKHGHQQREKGEAVFVVDVRQPREVIHAYLDNYLDHISKLEGRRSLPKDWRLMFVAWDLVREGKSHSAIDGILTEKYDFDEGNVRTISDWVSRIDGDIKSCKIWGESGNKPSP